MLSSHSPSKISARVSSRRMKMARAYVGDAAKDFNLNSGNISSTLDKLYAWEKKLYKEVKVWISFAMECIWFLSSDENS